ncbi:hypothetical protein E1B28_005616 [Marasmius oreades]|uniref:BHLH domain-containing protein n=1 Tax=Marasmius oreades TaxID=181124 RepID=A0A9P7UUF3_9AGAR|nr:uncharacterized protein E1B28_005616 [Marasmius oreades]KAG7094802.1 hypothetical protein E1B28_005616 [Marasmius oreades]
MPSDNTRHEWSSRIHDCAREREFGSEASIDFMASFFPVPPASGDHSIVSPPTPTIDIDIDHTLNAEPSSKSTGSLNDPGGLVTPLSPISTIAMSALDLNQSSTNPSSGQDKNIHRNAGSSAQTQEAIGQSMFTFYDTNSRQNQKNATNTEHTQTQASAIQGLGGLAGVGVLGGGSSLNPQLLNTNFDSLNNIGGASGGNEAGSPTGNVSQQIMLEQFRLAQLQQLQHLQAQIFQQQLAIINSGAMFGLHSESEGSPSVAQTHNQNHSRSSSLFHGLPTPGSSTELRASAPAVEFVSPMLLNFHCNDINDSTNNTQNNQNHSSYGASTSPSRQSHSHSNPHSVTQTPVFGAQEDDSANDMVLENLAPLASRFSRNSGNDTDSSSFYHRGTSSAPAHIAFSHPQTQHENDFDISPLTSPWLGAEGGTGNARSRVQAYNHRHLHHGQPHQEQSQMEWSSTSTKRASSPAEDHVRKTRQSHAVRATIPESIPSSVGPRRNSRSSRSVTSTPLMKGTPGGVISGNRSRKNSVAASKASPSNAGSSNTGPSASGTGTIGNNVGTDEMVQDSPSPVDLSLSMPPPATGSTSSQNTNASSSAHPSSSSSSSSSNSSSNPQSFGVGMYNMDMGFDFNFGGSATSPSRSYHPAPGSMPPPLVPVTPASIMNLGRGMNNHSSSIGVNSGGNGNGIFGGFENNQDIGMRRGSIGEGLGAAVLLPHSAAVPTSASSLIPPPSPSIDTPVPATASGPPQTTTGRKGKGKTAKDATGAGITEAAGVSTRSRSGRKGNVAHSPNLKAILPASNSVTNSPMLPPSPSIANNSPLSPSFPVTAVRKTSHKAAEQKRRDSLKTTFDDLRGLLPPIPLSSSDAADDLAGGGFVAGVVAAARASMLPGALPPRGPPKAGAEGPNKGVSKLQLLICGNEYIRVLKARVERRDEEVERLRREIRRLRMGDGVLGDVEDLEEGPIDLERNIDAIEWASVRAHAAVTTVPILEEGEEGAG